MPFSHQDQNNIMENNYKFKIIYFVPIVSKYVSKWFILLSTGLLWMRKWEKMNVNVNVFKLEVLHSTFLFLFLPCRVCLHFWLCLGHCSTVFFYWYLFLWQLLYSLDEKICIPCNYMFYLSWSFCMHWDERNYIFHYSLCCFQFLCQIG